MLSPSFLQLLRHIIPPGIRHLGIFHGGLDVRVSDPVLHPLDPEPLAQSMRGAAVLEHVEMPEVRRDAGRGAVLLHQKMERGAVDRPLLLRKEDRAREGSAYLQPGAERPGFLAHQVVMAGIRTLEPVDKDPPMDFGS